MEEDECSVGNMAWNTNATEPHCNPSDDLQTPAPRVENHLFKGNASSAVSQRRKDIQAFPRNL